VLLVDDDVKSPQGQVVIPANTQVVGYFETQRQGSRFVAQAIDLNRIHHPLEGTSRQLQRNSSNLGLGLSTGTGALAGTLFGGGVGALGGAALGAVSSYFTGSQPATIVPYQVIVIYLQQDWR
jgi:hypothetical protein